MVEKKPENFKKKVLMSSAFQNVLECFTPQELLEARYVNKRVGFGVAPLCFKYLRYNMPDDDELDDESKIFHLRIEAAKKVEISNINGGENHLKRMLQIVEKVGNKCEYLKLNFDGNDTGDDELAKKYLECFKKFVSVKTLSFEIIEDAGLTRILDWMMKDKNFPWFNTVRTVKIYLVRDMVDKSKLSEFLLMLK